MRHHKQKKYKGGDDNGTTNDSTTNDNGITNLGSQPFNSFGFENGASSAREAALLHEKNNNAMQHKLNTQSGGSDNKIEIPTFPPIGGIKQAYSSSDLSVGGNTNLINGINDAQRDCFATDTCKATTTGGKKRRTHKKKRLSKYKKRITNKKKRISNKKKRISNKKKRISNKK